MEPHNIIRRDHNVGQLFLQFHGPTTILLQTRAARIRDVLTPENVNEIADAQPTLPHEGGQIDPPDKPKASFPVSIKAPRMRTASIGNNGKVTFEPIGELETA